MGKIDKNSIQQQVFREIDKFESISLKQLCSKFPDEKKDKIKNYLTRWRKKHKPTPINLKKELEKIIKDYKTPASSRVHAIKELQRIHERENIKDGDDVKKGDLLTDMFYKLQQEKGLVDENGNETPLGKQEREAKEEEDRIKVLTAWKHSPMAYSDDFVRSCGLDPKDRPKIIPEPLTLTPPESFHE